MSMALLALIDPQLDKSPGRPDSRNASGALAERVAAFMDERMPGCGGR
jgi:hypothetical protein